MAVGVCLEHLLAVGVAPRPLAHPQRSAAITLNLTGDLRVEVFGVYSLVGIVHSACYCIAWLVLYSAVWLVLYSLVGAV